MHPRTFSLHNKNWNVVSQILCTVWHWIFSFADFREGFEHASWEGALERERSVAQKRVNDFRNWNIFHLLRLDSPSVEHFLCHDTVIINVETFTSKNISEIYGIEKGEVFLNLRSKSPTKKSSFGARDLNLKTCFPKNERDFELPYHESGLKFPRTKGLTRLN